MPKLWTFFLFLFSLANTSTIYADICASKSPKPNIKRYDLPLLVAEAKKIAADSQRSAIAAAQWDKWRAKWSWLPKFKVQGLLAPSPSIECQNPDCTVTTNPNASSFKIDGIFARISVDVAMPVYTFGKISALKRAAEQGISVEQAKAKIVEDQIVLRVIQAYWGLKTAREIIYAVCQGRKHLTKERKRVEKKLDAQDDFDDDDDAPKKKSKDSDDDSSVVTLTDLSRLKVYQATIDSKLLEAKKLERLTHSALALLIGKKAKDFEVDDSILTLKDTKLAAVDEYIKLANDNHPQIKMLKAATRAHHALADVERAKFLPDLLIVATGRAAVATGVDDPNNAFYNDPFNVLTGGFGLALSWTIDPFLQYGSWKKAKAKRASYNDQQKLASLQLQTELISAYENLKEAKERLDVIKKAQRAAKAWLTATAQNLAAGMAQPKDLVDVLPKYFDMKIKYFQAIYDVNLGWSKLGQAIGINIKNNK